MIVNRICLLLKTTTPLGRWHSMSQDPTSKAFKFERYYVEGIDFRHNESFLYQEPLDLNLEFEVELGVLSDYSQGFVLIAARIFNDAKANNYPFTLNLSIRGIFSTDQELSHDEFERFLEINGTAVLFPFLRSTLADITRSAGHETLVLPLMNIYSLMKAKEA